jgi:hypothetical protein
MSEGKVVPIHVVREGESEATATATATCILNLGTRWNSR